MTLLEILEHSIHQGFKISFEPVINQYAIIVEKDEKSTTQLLPLDSHFYEEKIVDCISFCKSKITK